MFNGVTATELTTVDGALMQALYKATNPHWNYTAGITPENRPTYAREVHRLVEELLTLGYHVVKTT